MNCGATAKNGSAARAGPNRSWNVSHDQSRADVAVSCGTASRSSGSVRDATASSSHAWKVGPDTMRPEEVDGGGVAVGSRREPGERLAKLAVPAREEVLDAPCHQLGLGREVVQLRAARQPGATRDLRRGGARRSRDRSRHSSVASRSRARVDGGALRLGATSSLRDGLTHVLRLPGYKQTVKPDRN